ncbi:MAG TPA: hypothetical protein VKT29_06710 [Terriglobales bacterium]|nr:hypothetical protein [Terriglobales bacterium]
MRGHSWFCAVAVGSLLLPLSAAPLRAQDDSVAAAAAASKKAAAAQHKVYGEDDVTVLRHKNHVPDAALAANCDAACQAKVKALLEQEAPGEWESHFDDALSAMKDDDSWQELFARVRAQNCADKATHKAPEDSNPTLLTDLRAKISEERNELNDLRREAMTMPPNSPDLKGKLDLLRVRAIKLVIMGVELASLNSDRCATVSNSAPANSTPAQQQ